MRSVLWKCAPAFVISRVIVVLLAVAAPLVVRAFGLGALAQRASHAGLLGWDASWYERIAASGYGGLGNAELRFFPLLSVVSRSLRNVPGLPAGLSVVIVANLASLCAFALLYKLVVFELGDEPCALRAVWVLALAPAAFVLVMGYADSLVLATSLAAFLGFRQRRYALAFWSGLLAGLCSPLGMLLAIPAAIEMGANWYSLARRERILATASVVAAPLGTAGYLGWAQAAWGSFWLPLSQQHFGPRQGTEWDPLVSFGRGMGDLFSGTHLGVAGHCLWLVAFVALAVVVFRKLPVSYGCYSVAVLLVVSSAPGFASLERYGLACFPLAVGAATLLGRRRLFWGVIGLSVVGLITYGLCTFIGVYVP